MTPLLPIKWARALGVVAWQIVGVVALLVLVETAVRLAAPEITSVGTDSRLFADSVFADSPGPNAGATGTSNGAEFTAVDVDGFGFWGYDAAFDSTAPSWLFLGDSVTMGIGVHPDSTFAGRLAALGTVNVLNPSVVGYSSRNYPDVTNAVLDAARPRVDRILMFWCLNDVYSNAPALDDPNATVRRVGGDALTLVRRHFRTYQLLKATFFDRPRTYWEHDRRLYTGEILEQSLYDVVAVAERAEEEGIQMDVILLPYEFQLRDSDADSVWHPQSVMRGRLAAKGIRVTDLGPPLGRHTTDAEALFLYGDGIHFSEAGHRKISELVWLEHVRPEANEGTSGRMKP